MNKIFDDVKFQLDMLSCLISNLSDEDYSKKGQHIHSIGAHVRHTLEYVILLVSSDLNKPINYADRKRDKVMESSRVKALGTIAQLSQNLFKPDQKIEISENRESYISSYNREMLYMHEHIVHHCALLKIELDTIPHIQLDPCFGFAKSTLKHMGIKVNEIRDVSA